MFFRACCWFCRRFACCHRLQSIIPKLNPPRSDAISACQFSHFSGVGCKYTIYDETSIFQTDILLQGHVYLYAYIVYRLNITIDKQSHYPTHIEEPAQQKPVAHKRTNRWCFPCFEGWQWVSHLTYVSILRSLLVRTRHVKDWYDFILVITGYRIWISMVRYNLTQLNLTLDTPPHQLW